MDPPFEIVQDVLKKPHPPIRVSTYHEVALSRDIVQKFLDTADGGVIGIAPAYGRNCLLLALAFSSAEHVLLVYLARKPPVKKRKNIPTIRELLQDLILCADTHTKFAFRMDIAATSLYLDLGVRITDAVDLLSAAQDSRHSLAALMNVLGGEEGLEKNNLVTLFQLEENAWAAWRAATLDSMTKRFAEVPRIDTRAFSESRLHSLAKLSREARRLIDLKPTRVENEVENQFSCKEGRLQVTSTRFKTRVLASKNQRVEVESTVGGKVSKFSGKTVFVDGRAARIALASDTFQGDTIRVTTIGRDAPTRVESQRASIVLNALQQTCTLLDNPFFQAIWLPNEKPAWSTIPRATHDISLYFPHATLNDSQRAAVRAILSNENANRVTLVQGPPGTGKTTVIAAAVMSILSSTDLERTVWVVAQSNVAVKNIAEKLADVDCDFTLLVSKDFHHDWRVCFPLAPNCYLCIFGSRRHEHLYGQIMDNVVRSDDLADDIVAVERRLAGIRVVLCTLSMLSHFRLSPITRLVPLHTVMVDEASQVEIGNFVPMLYSFSKSLQKLVFIGDDKQRWCISSCCRHTVKTVLIRFKASSKWNTCANRPSSSTPNIGWFRFSPRHIEPNSVFLLSMPEQLGSFIGKHVYDDKLKTVHSIATPCCRFISVKGNEVAKGRSWINVAEAQAAIAEARQYHAKGRSYRILTPYDAQRAILETNLKAAKIPWENKVFCVDSFQGNEDDYVILSTVRTEKIGFLAEVRRVNVMLSRCKKGMVICTNRTFLQGAAKDSLVGLLASEMGESTWN
ncbi:P-loop containing nucleoside triphosphate hydrolase protein [Mycena vulgaris]|nr:P-loop containing nucleoside triphosphate hydrolase protein [Mycena vulgaris]